MRYNLLVTRDPRSWRRPALLACVGLLAAAAAVRLALAGVSWWLDCADPPGKADIIVVLGGDYGRPIYAADLYRQGWAPEVWLARILPEEGEARARGLGIALLRETEINRAILLKQGVPEQAIRLYGQDVDSTRDEAGALACEFGGRGKRILLVTSRYHARRARLIFRRQLPGAQVTVCPTPYETRDPSWWRHKHLALNAVSELFRLANYLAGSPFGRQP
jgi:uncharacterized SAM-binding protein YcdF (DUF218 family)